MKFAFSLLLRLSLGLLLLVGLCLVLGVQARPAHAQSTLTVTDCSSDSQLQADVTQANTDNAGDTVTFACSGDIKLTSTLNIQGSMTIDGSGQSVTLDGNKQVQVLLVNSGITFNLKTLTVANGLNSASTARSGGLNNNFGTVTISNSTFANNSAPNGGYGGAIFNAGSMIIMNSAFTNNSAVFGGALVDTGTVTISNSSFATNTATANGGGIWTNSTVTIASSTFALNTATSGGGGGIYNGGTVNINGSILADNTAFTGNNCFSSLIDNGYNLESATDCGFTGTGSLQNTDPKLSPLANNGGPTQTMALQQGSPAIDVVPLSANTCPSTDQRGDPRPDDPSESACDIGAYESSYSPDSDLGLANMPTNITTNATSPQGATVTYTPPTATDESGDSSTASVNCNPASGSAFPIATTTVTCTATDSDDSNSPVSQSFTVTVKPLLTARRKSVSAREGSVFSGVVASGTAYGTSNPLTASITWGDGSSSTVSVTLAADGSYSVSGSHTYAEEGKYTITVSVSDGKGLSASASSSASVSDAALSAKTPTVVIGKQQKVTLHTVFFDADPNRTASDYTASITWGDGSTSSATIGTTSGGFTASGSHSYVKKGTYSVTVTVSDQGGSQIIKTASVTIK